MSIEIVLQKSIDCASSAISAVLGKEPQLLTKEFALIPRLTNRAPIVINMGFCNDSWQGLLTFGGTTEDVATIIGDEQLSMAIDALGETLNTIAGLIAALPESMDFFGELQQTTPMYMEGGAFYPKASSVQVDFKLDEAKICFGFAIRSVNP